MKKLIISASLALALATAVFAWGHPQLEDGPLPDCLPLSCSGGSGQ